MRRFLIKLLALVLGFGIVLWMLAMAVEYRLYRNTRHRVFSPQADWDMIHKQPVQVLFVGNSRMQAHIDMRMMFNHYQVPMHLLTQASRRLNILWFKFQKYTEYNALPKVIVLQCDYSALLNDGLNQNTFYGKEKFLTYIFGDRIGINQYFKHEVGFKPYEVYIPLVRYIPYPDFFRMHWRGKSYVSYEPNRYYAGNLIKPKSGKKLKPMSEKLLEVGGEAELKSGLDFSYVDSFARYCQQHGIRLICITPPQSWESYQYIPFAKKASIDNYMQKNHREFRNFCSPNYAADSLFFNHLHLNRVGAKIFTRELIHYFDSLALAQNLNLNAPVRPKKD